MTQKHVRLVLAITVCLGASSAFATKQDKDEPQRLKALLSACSAPTWTKDGKLTLGADVCYGLYEAYHKRPQCSKEWQAGKIGDHYSSKDVQEKFAEESTAPKRKDFAVHETDKLWRTEDGSMVGSLTPACAREYNLNRVHDIMEKQGKEYKPPKPDASGQDKTYKQ